jgi:hypothetical protein
MISSGSIPLDVDRRRAEVGVPELALELDDVERDALAGEQAEGSRLETIEPRPER